MKMLGMEREYFLMDKNGKILEADKFGFPIDECGYLVEVRGEPSSNPFEVAFSVIAKETELREKAEKLGFKLVSQPFVDKRKHREEFQLIGRKYGKHVVSFDNIYGKFMKDDYFARAGIHIHFSDGSEEEIETENGNRTIKHFNQLNIPLIVREMDRIFKEQIKTAKRIQGDFELKPHGFEYRSLPTNLDVLEVCKTAMMCFKDNVNESE